MQLLPFFSDSIIEKVNSYRNHQQIAKIHLHETKIVSKEFWNQIKHKKEFKLNGFYYDIASVKHFKNNVHLTVVKDTFEEKVNLVLHHFLKKNDPLSKNKKKPFQVKIPYISLIEDTTNYFVFCDIFYNTRNFKTLKGNTHNIVTTILKPPCNV